MSLRLFLRNPEVGERVSICSLTREGWELYCPDFGGKGGAIYEKEGERLVLNEVPNGDYVVLSRYRANKELRSVIYDRRPREN